MEIYIALLRGINVSGQKKIKMADLRSHLADLNYTHLQTYIQSGNIVFKQRSTDVAVLERQIHNKIKEKYGFEVPVMVKQPRDLFDAVRHNPMTEERHQDLKRIYFTFLSEVPAAAQVAKLQDLDYSPEEFVIKGDLVYFFSPKGYGRAKMNNNFFEKKLKVKATTRNWNTVHKLLEMAKGITDSTS